MKEQKENKVLAFINKWQKLIGIIIVFGLLCFSFKSGKESAAVGPEGTNGNYTVPFDQYTHTLRLGWPATGTGSDSLLAINAGTRYVRRIAPLSSWLSPYATTASLSGYATTSSLSSYATNTSLSNYALSSSLNSYTPTSRTITINGTVFDLTANRSYIVGDLSSTASYANPTWLTSFAYSKITGAPAGIIYTQGTGIGIAGGVITNSSPDQTVSITGTNGITVTGTYPSFTLSGITPTYNNAPARTINAAGIKLSTTRPVRVSYSVTHGIGLTIVILAGSSNVYLEISPDNSTWTTINQTGYSDGIAIAIAITKTQVGNVQGEVPIGYSIRLRGVVTGGGSATFTNGQEITN